MIDWSRALAEAFQNHVEIAGPTGPAGHSVRKRREYSDFPMLGYGTVPENQVVPPVPASRDPVGGGTDGTTGSAGVVPATVWAEPTENRELCVPGTSGTSGTSEIGQDGLRSAAVSPDALDRTAPLVGNDGDIVRVWTEGLASLDPAVPLRGHSARLWQQLIADGDRFLDVWGAESARLGWGTLDLFGVHPGAPAARYDVMGLIPMVRGGEVIAIEPTRATTRMPSGGLLTYLRRPQPGAVPIWNWGRH